MLNVSRPTGSLAFHRAIAKAGRPLLAIMAVGSLLLLSACTKPINPVESTLTADTGDLSLSVRIIRPAAAPGKAKAPASDFTTGVAILTKGADTVTVPLVINNGRATGSAGKLAAGIWNITVHFYNAEGLETYSGTSTVDVKNGKNTMLSLSVMANGGSVSLDFQVPDYTLWNALESEFSEEGPALLVFRNPLKPISFVPAVFGKGFDGSDREQHLVIPRSAISAARGTIEFWFTPNWGTQSGKYAYLLFPRSTVGGLAWMHLVVYGDGKIGYQVFASAKESAANANMLTAGTPIHIAIAWDSSGLEATPDTSRLYLNGVLAAQATASIDPAALSPDVVLGFAYDDYNYPPETLEMYKPDGVYDNLKIYPYGKTKFEDRFFE